MYILLSKNFPSLDPRRERSQLLLKELRPNTSKLTPEGLPKNSVAK